MTNAGEELCLQRLGFVDVGARSGLHAGAEANRVRVTSVLFEPDGEEAARLAAASPAHAPYKVVSAALGHIDGPIDLHLTENPACTSVLPSNMHFLDLYGLRPHFAVTGRETVSCRRFDSLYAEGGIPRPDIVKIDVQGFEYQVLLGFGGLLQDTLAIELETHLYPLYQHQALITDLARYLALFDFSLRMVSNARSPVGKSAHGELQGEVHFEGDLVEVDAFFTKNKRWLAKHTERQNDFDVACAVLGIKSYGS